VRELIFGLVEALGAVFYVVVAGALTVVGAFAEQASVHDLTAGQTTLGVWEAVFGAVLIYAGLNVAYYIALPRFRGETA